MFSPTSLKSELCRSFTAELLLLLECANQQADDRQKDALRAGIARGINWSEFAQLVERHRVVPHAYLALSRAASDLVPQPYMDQLSNRFQANTRRNLLAVGELTRIANATNNAEIPLMCVKGPALAMQLYGGLQCRQFKDIDLLVPSGHLVQAAGLLNELGYREQTAPLTSLQPHQLRRLQKYYKHVTLANPNKPGVVIELHWDLSDFGQFSLPPERLWGSGHHLTLGENRLHALHRNEEIVFLGWHGGMHRWKRLSWLFDLAQAIRSVQEFDETACLRAASELGVERHMRLAMSLVQTLTATNVTESANVPPPVRRQMKLSCSAMVADEMFYERKPIAGMLWTWQMSRTALLRPEALFHTFAPRIEHIHLSTSLAYRKRLRQLESRVWQLLLSRVPGLNRCKSSSSS